MGIFANLDDRYEHILVEAERLRLKYNAASFALSTAKKSGKGFAKEENDFEAVELELGEVLDESTEIEELQVLQEVKDIHIPTFRKPLNEILAVYDAGEPLQSIEEKVDAWVKDISPIFSFQEWDAKTNENMLNPRFSIRFPVTKSTPEMVQSINILARTLREGNQDVYFSTSKEGAGKRTPACVLRITGEYMHLGSAYVSILRKDNIFYLKKAVSLASDYYR